MRRVKPLSGLVEGSYDASADHDPGRDELPLIGGSLIGMATLRGQKTADERELIPTEPCRIAVNTENGSSASRHRFAVFQPVTEASV